MEKAKKILTYIALATMGISVFMLILAIFGVKIFDLDGVLFKILLSFATIAVASAFSINALNILKTQKIIPYISLGLLSLCSLFGFIVYWTNFELGVFNTITGVLAIATVFFCIIVSLNNKNQKRFFALQIITYIVICIVDIILSLLICGVEVFNAIPSEIFWVACLVAFGLLCTLAILGKKKNGEVIDDKKYIRVDKTEYESLKNRLQELEEENAELKKQLKK